MQTIQDNAVTLGNGSACDIIKEIWCLYIEAHLWDWRLDIG